MDAITSVLPPSLLLEPQDINLDGTDLLLHYGLYIDNEYRWPLALRFIKGAIHGAIILPVLLHATFTALIVALDHNVKDLGLPASIVSQLHLSHTITINHLTRRY